MTDPQKHQGGCHCGAIRYEVTLALDKVISCNCSMCQKRGSLLTFAPASAFTLKSGEGALTEYLFNKHMIHHLFCKICGILSFARGTAPDGTDTVAINARCLDDVDLDTLTIMKFDGRSS